jgi:hypothetical protein
MYFVVSSTYSINTGFDVDVEVDDDNYLSYHRCIFRGFYLPDFQQYTSLILVIKVLYCSSHIIFWFLSVALSTRHTEHALCEQNAVCLIMNLAVRTVTTTHESGERLS